MVRIGRMSNRISWVGRRQFIAGLGATTVAPLLPAIAAPATLALGLRAASGSLALAAGGPETPVWALRGPAAEVPLRFGHGDRLEVTLANELPVPLALDWRGMDGNARAGPLSARRPSAPGLRETFEVSLRQAGTFLCDPGLLADGQVQPIRPLPLVVPEKEPIVAVDRDEILLFEDWRLRADGSAIVAGQDPGDALPIHTVNGKAVHDIPLRPHQRLRLRLINSFQRHVIALKIEDYQVRVMALDSQPSEPFDARNGALVLAPGGRADVLIDATAQPGSVSQILLHDGKQARTIARLITSSEPPVRPAPLPLAAPLPSNGLPGQLDLKNALRVELAPGGSRPDWTRPAEFRVSSPPAFTVKAGRAAVLALVNRADIATVFHLHGHHFRLLDRLDDGWKPFWLDTLAIEPGQTQRIAFAAEHVGRWLIEAVASDWAAPRLVRCYAVE